MSSYWDEHEVLVSGRNQWKIYKIEHKDERRFIYMKLDAVQPRTRLILKILFGNEWLSTIIFEKGGGDMEEKQLTIDEKWQIAQDQGMHIIKPDGTQYIIYGNGETKVIGPDHPRWSELGHPDQRR